MLENSKASSSLIYGNRIFQQVELVSNIGCSTYEFKSGKWNFSVNLIRMFGYEPSEVTASKELFLFHFTGENKEAASRLLDHTNDNNNSEEVKLEVKIRKNELRFITMSRRVIEKGSCLLITFHDITDETKIIRDLEKKTKDLLQKNLELDSFNHIASHDLREPIRKIQTLLSMVLRYPELNLPGEVKGYFTRINRTADRMKSLILDLLEFSRTSKEKRVFKKCNLEEIISNVVEDFDFNINDSNTTVLVDDLPSAMIIPSQFEQLFTNLLDNALKYRDLQRDLLIHIRKEDITEMDLTMFPLSDKTSLVKISVTDNGVGFDGEFSDSIFLPFNRLHDKQRFPGSGVGLAICKKIMEHHGGMIYAEGAVGKGARFTILFPVLQEKVVDGWGF
ncbi:sensor histidine kinase [Algoriphagus vanfongensis]|uniref:sensor histidine kinase n=1 Tax=Algoriphagus vanfongensis TaxID=426371 RepID=UPI0004288BDB|nr:ATP-binding protein [Algoriphagus vanfongensis]